MTRAMIEPTRVSAAFAYSAHAHAMQLRKATDIPYLSHLMAVSALVLEHDGDDDQAIAALLHDVIEDCGAHHEATIQEQFGARVAHIVRGCTDADTTPKPPWQARKEAYLAHLSDAGADVLLVSACDKLHNARAILSDLRAIGGEVWDRFNAGKEGSLWYYRALVAAYRKGDTPLRLVDELDRTVTEIERLA